MRIAMIGHHVAPIGPPFAGGVESLTWYLARWLARGDHEIVLFAPPGSEVPGAEVRELALDSSPSAAARADVAMPPGAFMAAHHAYQEVLVELASNAEGFDLVHSTRLDVDCLPEPPILAALGRASELAGPGWLLCGPVGRLGPRAPWLGAPSGAELAEPRTLARSGPRPVPADGWLLAEPRAELFWSLSFAVSVADHARIGGFDEGYVGYGAEDTDYAFRARRCGVGLLWVSGAWSHHQHHPVSDPPVEHLGDIVRNANRFHRLWGRWPMPSWLAEFSRLGLVHWDPAGARLELRA